jgi:monofunctional biosynthetic peptidoglycan transglycosylase
MNPFFQKSLKFLKIFVILFFSLSIFSVILFRFVNPPFTPLMIIRLIDHDDKYGDRRLEHTWVSINEISPYMVQAVVAAEDNNFPTHFGIDFEAIKKARQLNKYSRVKHGASTISQQTAKNCFLVPSRTYIRKGFEVYFTVLIESLWSKQRIMEVYLNIIELGNGVYGIEAASQRFLHKSAKNINKAEAALVTSVLPSPLKRNLSKPNGYMYYYQNRVLKLMGMIGKVEL